MAAPSRQKKQGKGKKRKTKATPKRRRISRRAFLAQSTAVLVALGIPKPKATAIAQQYYSDPGKVSDALKASLSGFFEQVVFDLTSTVTEFIDPDENASIQFVIRRIIDDLGIQGVSIDLDIGQLLAASGVADLRIGDLLPGVDFEQVSIAELIARAVSPGVFSDVADTINGPLDTLRNSYSLPPIVNDILDNGLNIENLLTEAIGKRKGLLESKQFLRVFRDPEAFLVEQAFQFVPEEVRGFSIPIGAPLNTDFSVNMFDTGQELLDNFLDILLFNWLGALFDTPEYQEAREFFIELLDVGVAQLPNLAQAGSAVLTAPVEVLEDAAVFVDCLIGSVVEVITDPVDIVGYLEGLLDEKLEELDMILDFIESTYENILSIPDVIEDIPGVGYIISETAGTLTDVAEALIDAVNEAEATAEGLTEDVAVLTQQIEDSVLSVDELNAIADQVNVIRDDIEETAGGIASTVNDVRAEVGDFVEMTLEEYEAFVNAATMEVNQFLEDNKNLVRDGITAAEWAIIKAQTTAMALQRAALEATIEYGFQINLDQLVLIEIVKLFGRYNGFGPIDNLNGLSLAQFQARVDEETAEPIATMRQMRDNYIAVLDTLDAAVEGLDSVGQVVSNTLFDLHPLFQRRLDAFGITADTTIGESIVAAAKADEAVGQVIGLSGYDIDTLVSLLSVNLATVLGDVAAEQGLTAIANLTPAELAVSDIHTLGFLAVRDQLVDPMTEVVTNYFVTQIQTAFSLINFDLSAYDDIDPDLVDQQIIDSILKQAIVFAAKIGLGTATFAASEVVATIVFVAFSQLIRELLEEGVQAIFEIEV